MSNFARNNKIIMDELKKNKTRGGKRDGCGRKKLDATLISFRLQNDLLDILNKMDINKTDFINDAVRSSLKIEKIN